MRSTLKCDIIFPKGLQGIQMKKKIVYISGADVFDVKDVRAAFEEVRNTLNLDADTILFGVPVDDVSQPATVAQVTDNCVETVSGAIVDDFVDESDTDVVETVELPDDADSDEQTLSSPELSTEYDDIADSKSDTEDGAPVVPILSVLAGNNTDKADDAGANDVNDVAEVQSTETVDVIPESETDISQMLDAEMPEEAGEKTLEELLESMTPLQEDVQPKNESPAMHDDLDATLENLASEFAENQDKITVTKKGSERGKIGKLKNILPFTKKKRDDTGLMGDLFGWAGIAANDEDFSIPGFFANAVSKK